MIARVLARDRRFARRSDRSCRFRLDVDEDRARAQVQHGVGRGDERHRRRDHLGRPGRRRAHAARAEPHRAARHADHVFDSEALGERALELGDARAAASEIANRRSWTATRSRPCRGHGGKTRSVRSWRRSRSQQARGRRWRSRGRCARRRPGTRTGAACSNGDRRDRSRRCCSAASTSRMPSSMPMSGVKSSSRRTRSNPTL